MKVFIKDDDAPTGVLFSTGDDRPEVMTGPEAFLSVTGMDGETNKETSMYSRGYEMTHEEATQLYVMLGQALEGEEDES